MARTNGSNGNGDKGGKKRGRRGGDKRGSKSARGSDAAQDGILGALVREIWSAAESGGSGLSGMAAVLLRDGKVVCEVLKEVIAGSETKDELRGAMVVMYGGGMVSEPAARAEVAMRLMCVPTLTYVS